MQLARRQSNLGTETAFEILAIAKQLEKQGKDIVHLEIGEPDFETPQHIKDAAKKALDDGWTHYGPSAGQYELREVIAKHQTKQHGYSVDPEQVVVTPGAKPIMFFSMLALLQSGDEAIYPNPGFPIYESMIRYVGSTPIPLPLRQDNEYNPDIDELERLITDKTRLIIINSPSNPCGSVIPSSDLERIANIAVKHDLVVLSDEVYKDMYYEGQHKSISTFPGMRERTILLDGFSKSYAMTGWRIGYGILPTWLVEPMVRLVTNSVSCTSVFTQIAAIQALEGPRDSIDKMMQEFHKRRSIIVEQLNSLPGVFCPIPKGAFYAFPSIHKTQFSSDEFAKISLEKYGVALLSGNSFGKYGEGYVRVSFANSRENISKATQRLHKMLS